VDFVTMIVESNSSVTSHSASFWKFRKCTYTVPSEATSGIEN
jgi:hypothetical protein